MRESFVSTIAREPAVHVKSRPGSYVISREAFCSTGARSGMKSSEAFAAGSFSAWMTKSGSPSISREFQTGAASTRDTRAAKRMADKRFMAAFA